jgi:hypothetical protein
MIRTAAIAFLASISLAACAPSASNPPPVTTSSAPLIDGTSYDVTLSFANEAPIKDTLVFKSGRFESTACTALGFPEWTEYRGTAESDGVGFDVTTHHPKGTSVVWHGTVRGSRVSGTASRTMDGATASGSFEGIAKR